MHFIFYILYIYIIYIYKYIYIYIYIYYIYIYIYIYIYTHTHTNICMYTRRRIDLQTNMKLQETKRSKCKSFFIDDILLGYYIIIA